MCFDGAAGLSTLLPGSNGVLLDILGGMATLGGFTAVILKGVNFCDFLCALLYTSPFRASGLLSMERIYSPWGKFFSLGVDPSREGRHTIYDRVAALVSETFSCNEKKK